MNSSRSIVSLSRFRRSGHQSIYAGLSDLAILLGRSELQPTPPAIVPLMKIGRPPPTIMKRSWLEDCIPNAGPPAPATFAYSWVALRAHAAVKALLMATSMLVTRAWSIRTKASKWPQSSTTAMSMSTPISAAFASAPCRIVFASLRVKSRCHDHGSCFPCESGIDGFFQTGSALGSSVLDVRG
jgi:hypothetical protein